jgi:hypothetical protein
MIHRGGSLFFNLVLIEPGIPVNLVSNLRPTQLEFEKRKSNNGISVTRAEFFFAVMKAQWDEGCVRILEYCWTITVGGRQCCCHRSGAFALKSGFQQHFHVYTRAVPYVTSIFILQRKKGVNKKKQHANKSLYCIYFCTKSIWPSMHFCTVLEVWKSPYGRTPFLQRLRWQRASWFTHWSHSAGLSSHP